MRNSNRLDENQLLVLTVRREMYKVHNVQNIRHNCKNIAGYCLHETETLLLKAGDALMSEHSLVNSRHSRYDDLYLIS